MTERPHDIPDLFLAPVALEVDARIAELSALNEEKLALQIAVESDLPSWSVELRKDGVLRALSHIVDLHGWVLSWDERGVRLSHDEHSVVLGLPANVKAYVETGGST
jgi:hypothetical protein